MATQSCPDCGHDLPEGSQFCSACGASLTPVPQSDGSGGEPTLWHGLFERVRRAVAPKYQVRSVLGHGGMAGVYLAEESRLGREVAIKVMAPALMADPSMIRRFEQEARTIAQLDHSHIVTIYDIGSEEDLHFFAMTYVPGRSLSDVIDSTPRPLPAEVVRHWMAQTAYALGYAHRLGVVHRDIKPGNILLNREGDVVVTDFGIAKVTDEPGLTRTGMLVGTPAYMSPEQCASGEVTGATDQYALGIVAYQLLTGGPPFTGDTYAVMRAHVDSEPPPITQARPQCPASLAETVHRMLAKDPSDRWPSMADVARELQPRPLGAGDPLRDALARLATPAHDLVVDVPDGDDSQDGPAPGVCTVFAGERLRLEAEARGPDGQPLPDRRIRWRSDRPELADVDEDGIVHGHAVGEVRVAARCGGASRSVDIEVLLPPIETVEIQPTERSIAPGDAIRLVAHARRRGGAVVEGTAVRWASSDPSIAKVDAHGNVEAVGSGEAIITATIEGQTAEATLEVPAPVDVTPAAPPPADEPSTDPATGREPPSAPIGATEILEGGPISGSPPQASPPPSTPPPADPTPSPAAGASPEADDAPQAVESDPSTAPRRPSKSGSKGGSVARRRRRVGAAAVAVVLLGGAYLVLGGDAGDAGAGPAGTDAAGGASGAVDPPGAQLPAVVESPDAEAREGEGGTDPGPGDERGEPAETDVGQPAVAEPEDPADDPSAAELEARQGDPTSTDAEDPETGVPDPGPGTLTVATALPADAQVTATGRDGTVRAVVGGSAELAPGSYELRIVADGYDEVRASVTVAAGETLAWSPQLVERPDPAPVQPEEDSTTEAAEQEDPTPDDPAPEEPDPEDDAPTTDPAADRAEIGAAIAGFVTAMDERDTDGVLPTLPEDVRDGWRALLSQDRVSEWSATLVGEPEIEPAGDSAVVRFSMALSYYDPSAGDVDQELQYQGRAERGPDGWRLLDLRTVE